MRKYFFLMVFLFILIGFPIISNNSDISKENKIQIENDFLGDTISSVNPNLYVATDDVGRELTTNLSKSSNHYRAVGIFYWTWHLEQYTDYIYNVNNIAKANPDKIHDYDWWTNNYKANAYYWNEPIYGYYRENDDYVLRKQAELLADAGVDFVVFDCTNGTYTWQKAYTNLLKVWKEAKNQGVKVPQIVFMLQFAYSNETETSFKNIYEDLYDISSDNYKKYNDLFFKYNGKPLILLHTGSNMSNEMKNRLKEFEVRSVDASYFYSGAQPNGKWGWLSTYQQAYYKKADGSVEQVSVGVAQNASYKTNRITAMNGENVMGRSYAKDNYSYNFKYRGNTITVGETISGSTAPSKNTSLYGRNFQQQWDYAIELDPEIVFVTGWNEWLMGRFKNWPSSGTSVKNAFPDQFNDEYSRDIEPSNGELKDNYYYQLVENIRRYKGVTSQTKQKNAITIKETSDWNNSNIISYNHYTGGKNRNAKSFSNHPIKYKNDSFRNDITKAKVSYDNSYIYFYVETKDNLTSYDSDKWMRLLIDTENSTTSTSKKNWEEFEYIVNRTKGTSSTLNLEKSTGGWKFEKVDTVKYKVTKNVLEITIPRKSLGLTDKKISFNFKWCDNNLTNGDIMTVYTDGDAAPGGRFAFYFEGSATYKEQEERTATEQGKSGDVDNNGKIESADYVLLRKYIMNQITLSSEGKKNADINVDGKINSADYVAIRKIILKK